MTGLQQRTVWIVNHYSTIPSKDGASGRHLRLAQELRTHGWQAVLFLASTRHPSGAQYLPPGCRRRRGSEGGSPYVMVRATGYRGGLSRTWNMLEFAVRTLQPSTAAQAPRPDVVIGSTVHLLAAWAAMRLAKRYSVPFVFEIRDIWPETLVDLGKLKPGGAAAWAMARVSRRLCAASSLVISPLPGIRTYLDELGLQHVPFTWISNGADLPGDPEGDDPQREDDFVLMYLGSHGHANGVRSLLDAFERAAAGPGGTLPLRLRLVGDGTQKKSLMNYARSLASRDRISFEDSIPRGDVVRRAREADALIVNLEELPVYRYGISLNKLFDYLASGRPTIIATSALNNPVAEARAGLTVRAGDVEALAAAIREMSLVITPESRTQMGRRGREHLQHEYTFSTLGARLATALDNLAGTRKQESGT